PYGAANKMNRNGLPGNVVTDKLLADIDQERNNSDKGVQARILRAARMYAIIKGIGFNGVHIGGHNIKYEQVEEIIRQGEALAPQWTELIKYFDYPMKNGFYYFEFDPKTGLNKEKPIDPQTVETAGKPEIFYGISRFFHMLMFEPGKKLYGIMKAISGKIAGSKLENIFHKLEYLTKVLIFNCRDCGDCALIDVAYLCPMSQCPKNQRNGACGGSYQGWCEVYPFKKQCIYVRAYARLKKYAQEKQLEQNIVPPCNWDLHQSSSWLNFYLGKDHNAKKQDNSPAGK
ncbi:MAG TPA: methylenetetrahydrofolate reductase C-terminal domain-containing protein, partial [Smithellaceae bacterium]|nr:methylenetetrahydrofolate reductase C-terminal domain-containing protein [Smithellaceae bacterium]